MQELYAALALLKIKTPQGAKKASEEEDRFYQQATEVSAPFRLAEGAIIHCCHAMKYLVQQNKKRRNRTSRDEAEAEGVNCVVMGGAGDGDSAGGSSGHHDERLPERKT